MGKISGFAFEGSGRLARKDTYTTKSGKEILTLVVQVEGTYPQLVPIKFFGRMADQANALTIGDVIEVTGHMGGRDWNGKVYGDNVGETIEVVHSASAGEQQEMPGTGGAGKHSERRASDPPPAHGWGGTPDDDLPF
jgi:hypothetical protein